MIDVQNSEPEHKIELERVGIEGLRHAVIIKRPTYNRQSIVTINSYIILPSNQRGAHMSRFVESVNSIPDEISSIEDLAELIANDALKRHGFDCETEITSDLPFEKIKPSGKKENGVAKMFSRYSTRTRRKTVGVSVTGILACPCSKELTNGLTHNQRGELSVGIEITNDDVELYDIIDLMNKCFSSPTFSLLKRPEEKGIVEKIHQNPKFVEDVTRECVTLLRERYPKKYCKVKCISFESIHDHNVFAEWNGVL